MQIETSGSPTDSPKEGQTSTLDNSTVRAKTAIRLKYEAEARMILKKFGGLAGIQARLDLSQRKICQLLLVDPSSWSRWLTHEDRVPPHILRSLEWCLAVLDKYPGFDVHFWLHSSRQVGQAAIEKTTQLTQNYFTAETENLKQQLSSVEKNVLELKLTGRNRIQSRAFLWGVALGFCVASATYFLKRFF